MTLPGGSRKHVVDRSRAEPLSPNSGSSGKRAVTAGLNALPATEIAAGVRSGAFSAEAVADACLERIEIREGIVGAWEYLDADLARNQARAVDRAGGKGALAGVPVGVKDIIDTCDMPTGMGSPIYAGNRPQADASCVARLRAAGAVVLGKTVTCEFAGLTPGRTANPHDPAHTPGGSSSGSAAAVADHMVPVALGTQTGGSVVRPSSYCGVTGYKPSFGTFSLAGVFPAAESLDTLGLHARNVDDIALLSSVLAGRPFDSVCEPAPVVGLCRTWWWSEAQSETRDAVESAAGRLAAAGFAVRDLTLPDEFRRLCELRGVINARERAMAMADAWERGRELISPRLQNTIREGLALPYGDYVDALRLMDACRMRIDDVFAGCDAILTPAVDGEAPRGLGDTGSPRFQSLWTMLRTPAITLPAHAGPCGLPVGIQLVARWGCDDLLFGICRRVTEVLS